MPSPASTTWATITAVNASGSPHQRTNQLAGISRIAGMIAIVTNGHSGA